MSSEKTAATTALPRTLPPAVSIVGRKNAGKTTFIERLIPELVQRGRRVATIKHDAHDFEIDLPGKDTWRHREAGSAMTVIASAGKVATVLLTDREAGLDELLALVGSSFDLVLVEGYRSGALPKILILADDRDAGPEGLAGEVVAIVSDGAATNGAAPRFATDDIASVADLIDERFLAP